MIGQPYAEESVMTC